LVVVATILTVAGLVLWIVGAAQADDEFDGLMWIIFGSAAGLIAVPLWWMAACIPIVRRVGFRWIPALGVWTLVAVGLALYERAHITSCEIDPSSTCGDPGEATWFIGSVWAYFAVPLACAGLIVGRDVKRSSARG